MSHTNQPQLQTQQKYFLPCSTHSPKTSLMQHPHAQLLIWRHYASKSFKTWKTGIDRWHRCWQWQQQQWCCWQWCHTPHHYWTNQPSPPTPPTPSHKSSASEADDHNTIDAHQPYPLPLMPMTMTLPTSPSQTLHQPDSLPNPPTHNSNLLPIAETCK